MTHPDSVLKKKSSLGGKSVKKSRIPNTSKFKTSKYPDYSSKLKLSYLYRTLSSSSKTKIFYFIAYKRD